MTMITDNLAAARFVDPEPVQAHILTLEAAGMSASAIAALAECHEAAIVRIATGAGEFAVPVHRETADRILLIPIELTAMPTLNQLPSRGSRRRIQALGAMGWSTTLLAREAGIPEHSLEAVLSTPLISVSKERAISGLFRKLWDQPAPEGTPDEQFHKICALSRAESEGWVTALAWDDIDQDDDPAPTPRHDAGLVDEVAIQLAITGQLVPLTARERDIAVRRLRDQDVTGEEIANRLKISLSSVYRTGEEGEAGAAA